MYMYYLWFYSICDTSLAVTSCTTIAMEIAMECVLIRDRNHVGERVNGFAGVWWLSR